MSALQVGYASVNINPPLGIGMMGYYIPRYAKGFLDDLEASAMALSLESETVLLISVDTCLIFTEQCRQFLKQIAPVISSFLLPIPIQALCWSQRICLKRMKP